MATTATTSSITTEQYMAIYDRLGVNRPGLNEAAGRALYPDPYHNGFYGNAANFDSKDLQNHVAEMSQDAWGKIQGTLSEDISPNTVNRIDSWPSFIELAPPNDPAIVPPQDHEMEESKDIRARVRPDLRLMDLLSKAQPFGCHAVDVIYPINPTVTVNRQGAIKSALIARFAELLPPEKFVEFEKELQEICDETPKGLNDEQVRNCLTSIVAKLHPLPDNVRGIVVGIHNCHHNVAGVMVNMITRMFFEGNGPRIFVCMAGPGASSERRQNTMVWRAQYVDDWLKSKTENTDV
jgi:hypothetical protein